MTEEEGLGKARRERKTEMVTERDSSKKGRNVNFKENVKRVWFKKIKLE